MGKPADVILECSLRMGGGSKGREKNTGMVIFVSFNTVPCNHTGIKVWARIVLKFFSYYYSTRGTEEKSHKDQVVTASNLLNHCLHNSYESPPALGS